MIATIITLYAIILVILLVCSIIREHRLKALSFEDLLAKLDPIRTEGAASLSVQIQVNGEQSAVNIDHVWRVVGGSEGLRRMQANAEILVVLASLVEARKPDVNRMLIEQLRRDGISIRHDVYKIRLAVALQWTTRWAAYPLQHAITAYWSMVYRILFLYKENHGPRALALRAACNVDYSG